jgi:hypothetical protein
MKPKVVPIAEAPVHKRQSPATRIIESLDGNYETMGTMAKRYDIHIETMRRLCKARNPDGTKKVQGPSEAVTQGDLVIYLFNENDVEAMDAYMERKGRVWEVTSE